MMIEFVLKTSIVGLLVFALVTFVARRNAATAARLLWVGLGVVLICPWLTIWTPMAQLTEPLPRHLGVSLAPVSLPPHQRNISIIERSVQPPVAKASEPTGLWISTTTERIIVAVQVLGALIALVILFIRLNRSRRQVRLATPWRMHKGIDIALSDQAISPYLWSLGRATIVLPAEAVAWDEKHLGHIIDHEYAHWRRGDGYSLIVAHMIWALFWWHPVIRALVLLHDRLVEEACDDSVILKGVDPADYADTLLVCAKGQRNRLLAQFGDSLHIKDRIRRILRPSANRGKRSTLLAVALSPLLIAATGLDTRQINQDTSDALMPSGVRMMTELRRNGLPPGTLQLVLFYDGDPSAKNYFDIEMVDEDTGGRFWSRITDIPKFDQEIPTWELSVGDGFAPSGRVRIGGLKPDGYVDGLAYGFVWRDHERAYHTIRSQRQIPVDYPMAVCTWPLAFVPTGAEAGYREEKELWQVNSIRHAICGAELVTAGVYSHDL